MQYDNIWTLVLHVTYCMTLNLDMDVCCLRPDFHYQSTFILSIWPNCSTSDQQMKCTAFGQKCNIWKNAHAFGQLRCTFGQICYIWLNALCNRPNSHCVTVLVNSAHIRWKAMRFIDAWAFQLRRSSLEVLYPNLYLLFIIIPLSFFFK